MDIFDLDIAGFGPGLCPKSNVAVTKLWLLVFQCSVWESAELKLRAQHEASPRGRVAFCYCVSAHLGAGPAPCWEGNHACLSSECSCCCGNPVTACVSSPRLIFKWLCPLVAFAVAGTCSGHQWQPSGEPH